jgi:hypothetical protein
LAPILASNNSADAVLMPELRESLFAAGEFVGAFVQSRIG